MLSAIGTALITIVGCMYAPSRAPPSRQAVRKQSAAPSALWATIPRVFMQVAIVLFRRLLSKRPPNEAIWCLSLSNRRGHVVRGFIAVPHRFRLPHPHLRGVGIQARRAIARLRAGAE